MSPAPPRAATRDHNFAQRSRPEAGRHSCIVRALRASPVPDALLDPGVTATDAARPRLHAVLLSGLLAVAAVLVLRGIGDESALGIGADDVRYVMNGVFLGDLLRDGRFLTPGGALDYARHYYAQYPALS